MKVLFNVEDLGNGTFNVYSDDRAFEVYGHVAMNYKPVSHEDTTSKVDDAIKLKKIGFEDDAILEILKGK